MKFVYWLILCGFLSACAANSTNTAKQIPQRSDRSSANQLAKNDFDRMADVELAENTQSVRLLMTKLYKRNPRELSKSTSDSMDKMVDWVFEGELQHQFKFKEIDNKQGTDAIFLAFDANYQGDRVLPFIVGLHTMLLKAHGNKKDFYLTDSIDPQNIYNVARNIEIAAWKLSTSRDANGNLYLVTNELSNADRNLSFEREFGKMIGRTDLYAISLAEKSQRLISRIMQSIATAAFLPF
ncbi:MAG: hypothetical protein V4545_07845 [Pseudomonadota bacterium]